jgi:hypothetical protein
MGNLSFFGRKRHPREGFGESAAEMKTEEEK